MGPGRRRKAKLSQSRPNLAAKGPKLRRERLKTVKASQSPPKQREVNATELAENATKASQEGKVIYMKTTEEKNKPNRAAPNLATKKDADKSTIAREHQPRGVEFCQNAPTLDYNHPRQPKPAQDGHNGQNDRESRVESLTWRTGPIEIQARRNRKRSTRRVYERCGRFSFKRGGRGAGRGKAHGARGGSGCWPLFLFLRRSLEQQRLSARCAGTYKKAPSSPALHLVLQRLGPCPLE